MPDNIKLCDYCKGCRKSRVATSTHPLWATSSKADREKLELYKEGEFVVKCDGIPEDYKDMIPDDIRQLASEEELESFVEILDPVRWAEKNVGWSGRVSPEGLDYQDIIIRCSARKRILRIGRRAGKTALMRIVALSDLFLKKKFLILLVTPFNSQKDLFVNGVEDYFEEHPHLKSSIKKLVHTPNFELELTNGSKLIAFTAGSANKKGAQNIRGQEANRIILDEADYLSPKDFEAINFILGNSHPVHGLPLLFVSSTPSGERNKYYTWCHDPTFKEFHFPSSISPMWSAAVERELKEEFTEQIYAQEVLAEFGEDEEGVFKTIYVDAAFNESANYDISRAEGPLPGWIYCQGVDWNSQKHGTKIYTIGFNPALAQFKVVDAQSVSSLSWNLTSAVNAIVSANEFWNPAFIYVDDGYGAFQIETLRTIGLQAPPGSAKNRLATIVKGINFGGFVELTDPWTMEIIKKPFKPFLVQNAVRVFERYQISVPQTDTELKAQLLNYKVFRITANNQPIYKPKDDKTGDHCLDALMLGLMAFTKEFSEFSDPMPTIGLGWAYDPTEPKIEIDDPVLSMVINKSTRTLPGNRNIELSGELNPGASSRKFDDENSLQYAIRSNQTGMRSHILTGKRPSRSNF
jgi:hypothetical protein